MEKILNYEKKDNIKITYCLLVLAITKTSKLTFLSLWHKDNYFSAKHFLPNVVLAFDLN